MSTWSEKMADSEQENKSLFQDDLIQLSAEERALGSDYGPEKALGSDYEPKKALGSDYEWKTKY